MPPVPMQHYEIVIQGEVNPNWCDWFDGLALTATGDGRTCLQAALPDQSALRALLERIFDLNFTLISVNRQDETSD